MEAPVHSHAHCRRIRAVQCKYVNWPWWWLSHALTTADLHATLAYHDVSGIRNQIKFEHYAGRIEVTHFEESMVYVTFSGLQGHKAPASTLDPQLQALGDETQFQGPLHELYLLDSDADDLPGKIEMYIKKTAPFFYEREASDFMRPTLLLAAELSQQKKVCS